MINLQPLWGLSMASEQAVVNSTAGSAFNFSARIKIWDDSGRDLPDPDIPLAGLLSQQPRLSRSCRSTINEGCSPVRQTRTLKFCYKTGKDVIQIECRNQFRVTNGKLSSL